MRWGSYRLFPGLGLHKEELNQQKSVSTNPNLWPSDLESENPNPEPQWFSIFQIKEYDSRLQGFQNPNPKIRFSIGKKKILKFKKNLHPKIQLSIEKIKYLKHNKNLKPEIQVLPEKSILNNLRRISAVKWWFLRKNKILDMASMKKKVNKIKEIWNIIRI